MTNMPLGLHGLLNYRAGADRPGVAARLYTALGAGNQAAYTREDCAWSIAQPNGSGTAFVWTAFDAWITDAANAGLFVWPILNKPPVWATGGATTADSWTRPPITEPATADYATFCAAFAARYGPGGTFWTANPTVPYKPMAQFEIWNEPYKQASWKNPADGTQMYADTAAYARMFTAAADAIHAAIPSAKVFAAVDVATTNVLGGALTTYLDPFLAETGVAAKIDGLSVHPYIASYRPFSLSRAADPRSTIANGEWKRSFGYGSTLIDARDCLNSHGLRDLPMWITEVGWPTILTGSTPMGATQAAAEAQQAMRVHDVFAHLRTHDRLVQGLIFYTYQTFDYLPDQPALPGYDATNQECFFGFVHNDGSGGAGDGTTATAKPALTALTAEATTGVVLVA